MIFFLKKFQSSIEVWKNSDRITKKYPYQNIISYNNTFLFYGCSEVTTKACNEQKISNYNTKRNV